MRDCWRTYTQGVAATASSACGRQSAKHSFLMHLRPAAPAPSGALLPCASVLVTDVRPFQHGGTSEEEVAE